MLCRITGKMCTAWSETAGCGLVRCKFVEEKGGDKRVTDSRKSCPMRHENGNCTVAGGFCTAVNDPICEALHSAFDCGYRSAIRARQEVESKLKVVESNAPLTLAELREMGGEPVWIKLFDPDEAFLVLRNEWVDTRNPEPMILFHMRWYSHADYGKTWLAYRRKPEEDSAND